MQNLQLETFFCFFQNSRDFAIILSSEGVIINANKMVSDLCEVSQEDLEGLNYFNFVENLRMTALVNREQLKNLMPNTAHLKQVLKIKNKIIEWSVLCIEDQKNSKKNYLLLGIDLTYEEQIKKLNQKNAEQLQIMDKLNQEVLGSSAKEYESPEKYAYSIRHHLASIIACMPGNIYWIDKNGIHLGCNNNVAKLLGLKSPSEYVGLTYEKIGSLTGWNKGQMDSFRKDDQEVINTGCPKFNVEEPPVTDLNGNTIYYLTSRVPIFDEKNEEVTGVIGISIDITERKIMEEKLRVAMKEAEASNRAKSEFIANMSHDVRTPLGSIYAMTDILSTQFEDPEVVDQLKMLSQASKQLLAFFNNCIEMVRMEAGEMALQEENFQVKKLFGEVAELYEPSLYLKKLKFYLHYARDLPEAIYASKEGLQAMLMNLLSNALKFTEQGSIKLSVSAEQNSDGAAYLKVRVSDTGIGIPEDKLPTIFDRFSRGTASYEGVYEGHGLGLHIVQKFVHLMKGEVSVETEVGKGSCFTLTFPFKEPQEGKTKIPKERFRAVSRSDTQAEAKLRILVVEDNPIGQMAVKLILNKLGYEVELSDTAEKVFAQLESGKYALIFMDVGIPGMSGDELASAIRRSEKTAQSPRTPIIGLTAHADEETLQKCRDAGMDEVLLKPLTEETASVILKDYAQKGDY